MLIAPSCLKVCVYTEATDMRKSFYGLYGLVVGELGEDPLSGTVYVFLNKRADYLKALYWHGDGLCLWAKRRERGNFDRLRSVDGGKKRTLTLTEFQMLVAGVDLKSVKMKNVRAQASSVALR